LLGMVPVFMLYPVIDIPSAYESPILSAMFLGSGFVMRRVILWLRGRVIRRDATSMTDAEALIIVLDDLKEAMARPIPEDKREAHERLRQFSLKALRQHLLDSFPEVPT